MTSETLRHPRWETSTSRVDREEAEVLLWGQIARHGGLRSPGRFQPFGVVFGDEAILQKVHLATRRATGLLGPALGEKTAFLVVRGPLRERIERIAGVAADALWPVAAIDLGQWQARAKRRRTAVKARLRRIVVPTFVARLRPRGVPRIGTVGGATSATPLATVEAC